MTTLAKMYVKQHFPKFALRFRVNKILKRGLDPDLHLLANVTTYLSAFRHFSKATTAIDVGAYCGEYSYILAKSFQHVLSIEPLPEMILLLKRSLPRHCEIVQCAVGEVGGEAHLRIPKIGDYTMDALATVADHSFAFSNIDTIETIRVKQLTIDKLVTDRNLQPAFLKIDVEGYEMNVLRGAMTVIATHKPLLMIEIEKRHNKDFQAIFSFLESQGYMPYHFCGGQLCPSSPNVVDDSYRYLVSSSISGIPGIIDSRLSGNYINNFMFLPVC
jgi:FkbM family methyltransferase